MKTDQEMLESLKKRQKIYIRERNRKIRVYGTVFGCFLAVFVLVRTAPLFMEKTQSSDTISNELEMRIESIKNDPAFTQYSDGRKNSDAPVFELNDGTDDASVYSFDHDGEFICFLTQEGYQKVYELMSKKTGTELQADENEILEIDRQVYFVWWHEDAGYCGLYGRNTTKENFTAVYHKLTQD